MNEIPHSISVIIVNYNVRFFLEQALRSVLKAAASLSVQIWVVDNASTDGSVEMVRAHFPSVQLRVNKENVGFARANNQAISLSNAQFILLLNPDTLIEESTLTKCLQFMALNPSAGALGVRMIDGTGHYLPESKRGIPTPWVAFCKTFGLSALFPNTLWFDTYHLGYLPENKTAEVPVLSGAFMFLRNEALKKSGLLDEDFFMYGEDIDLSVRILNAGFKNFYFPDTTIIHYKGESTRKGTLNYVRVFYQAMVLFAQKHYAGNNRNLYICFLYGAIYMRAIGTLLSTFLKKFGLPLIDAMLLYGGLFFLQFFWGLYRFADSSYYDLRFFYVNAPLYVLIWMTTLFFTGFYHKKIRLSSLLSGLALGSLIIAALYGFFEPAYRSSRALIILGTLWSICSLLGFRLLANPQVRKDFFQKGRRRCFIVGSPQEGQRTRQLLDSVGFNALFSGIISPSSLFANHSDILGSIEDLEELCRIHQIDDIIFCSRDVSSSQIMFWMINLGSKYQYRIMQEFNNSMISSYSKNNPGELFTYRIHLNLADDRFRKQKRVFDLIVCVAYFILILPLAFLNGQNSAKKWSRFLAVLKGNKTWFGYGNKCNPKDYLPEIPTSIHSVASLIFARSDEPLTEDQITRANHNYAQNYTLLTDVNLLFQFLFPRKSKSGKT
jgi:GT2 family glycosyltransferase